MAVTFLYPLVIFINFTKDRAIFMPFASSAQTRTLVNPSRARRGSVLTWPSATVIALAAVLTGCASVTPSAMPNSEQQALLQTDRARAVMQSEPVSASLSLHEAVARSLKYNLEHRSQLMAQAIALGTADLTRYDMLPKVMANAGYNNRNNDFLTRSRDPQGNFLSTPPFTTSAREYTNTGLALSWNLLDFGVSYYTAQQNADRFLQAGEKRRRTMHLLIQEVQVAYLRAATAQQLEAQLSTTITQARQALSNASQSEQAGLRDPLDALRYQRNLIESVRVLSTIHQEMASAMVDLNQLLNLPPATRYQLQDPQSLPVPGNLPNTSMEELEARALANNAQLRESIYEARIAAIETRKSLVRLFPSINVNTAAQHSNNAHYVNQSWVETSAQLSFNLWNLLLIPQTRELAKSNGELAEHRRMMVQMAILGQVHVAQLQLQHAREVNEHANAADAVEMRIASITQTRNAEGAASEAERIVAKTAAIVARLRRSQALSQLYAAHARLQATVGMEPQISALHETSLTDLTASVSRSFDAWQAGQLPSLDGAQTSTR